ncbi:MAG: portal protein, partial [Cetobacterium sp.]
MPTSLTSEALAKAVLRRYEGLVTQRLTSEQGWQRLAELMRPLRASVTVQVSPGTQRTQHIFDGTVLKVVNDLASALSGSMTSIDYQWFTLQMGFEPLNQDYETQRWLEDCSHRIFLAFQQSNFGSEMHELYHDLIVFGTACMWMDERPITNTSFNGFVFKTIAPGKYVIAEDANGMPSVVGSELTMSYRALNDEFGDSVSDAARKAGQKNPDDMVSIVRMIEELPQAEQTPRKKYQLV